MPPLGVELGGGLSPALRDRNPTLVAIPMVPDQNSVYVNHVDILKHYRRGLAIARLAPKLSHAPSLLQQASSCETGH